MVMDVVDFAGKVLAERALVVAEKALEQRDEARAGLLGVDLVYDLAKYITDDGRLLEGEVVRGILMAMREFASKEDTDGISAED
jgi:hypothetical protein